MNSIASGLRTSLVALILLAVVLCGVYPIVVWGLAQVLFPHQANGTLIMRDGKVVGSELIGQNFTGAKYFHPRPSAAGETGYDATNSGGSNLGPLSTKLIDSVKDRIERYRSQNNLPGTMPVPVDAVTASASGLDPHITVRNAFIQASRVARARGMSEAAVRQKVVDYTERRGLGVFGEDCVNVLKLNLALDGKP